MDNLSPTRPGPEGSSPSETGAGLCPASHFKLPNLASGQLLGSGGGASKCGCIGSPLNWSTYTLDSKHVQTCRDQDRSCEDGMVRSIYR
jgi:hypothetical protein